MGGSVVPGGAVVGGAVVGATVVDGGSVVGGPVVGTLQSPKSTLSAMLQHILEKKENVEPSDK